MKKAVDDDESVEEELYCVEDSDVNDFNKNDVDVKDNVEAEEGVEDEEEEQSDDSESVEVWARQIPKKNTPPGGSSLDQGGQGTLSNP